VFFVQRINPKYYEIYYGVNLEKKVIVENFDLDWHLTNFVKNKLPSDNPVLVFKWMLEPE